MPPSNPSNNGQWDQSCPNSDYGEKVFTINQMKRYYSKKNTSF